MGSKNGVLHLIRYMLDRHYDKKYFVDVFGGGFAVSHYVLERTNMRVMYNDKNKYVAAFLEKLLYEGLPDKAYDFVSRELFFDVINNPDNYDEWYVGYVSTIWSFGNSQKGYMFGSEIEQSKKAVHDLIVHNKFSDEISFLKGLIPDNILDIDYKVNKEKRLMITGIIKKALENVDVNPRTYYDTQALNSLVRSENLERLQKSTMLEELTRLERVQSLERLERVDYIDFIKSIPDEVLKDAIIYCDPPYEDTATYAVDGFNHIEFWQWFRDTPFCVYVSSYNAPDDIKPLNFEYKAQLLSGGSGKVVKENIYWNGKGDPIPTMEDLLFNDD